MREHEVIKISLFFTEAPRWLGKGEILETECQLGSPQILSRVKATRANFNRASKAPCP